MNILKLVKKIAIVLIDFSNEKNRIILEKNRIFSNLYISGKIDWFIICSCCCGKSEYQDNMSSSIFTSGFEVKIKNDTLLTLNDCNKISRYIFEDEPFLKQLLVSGFSTLYIGGENTNSINYNLKNKL